MARECWVCDGKGTIFAFQGLRSDADALKNKCPKCKGKGWT